MNFKKILKILVIFAIFGFSFSSFLALNHNMGNDHNQKISNCLLMMTNSCQMNIAEHLLIWQETFLASANSNFIFILSLLAVSLSVTYIKYGGNDPPPLLLKRYEKENRSLNIFNYLLNALSRGIVHSEIYA